MLVLLYFYLYFYFCFCFFLYILFIIITYYLLMIQLQTHWFRPKFIFQPSFNWAQSREPIHQNFAAMAYIHIWPISHSCRWPKNKKMSLLVLSGCFEPTSVRSSVNLLLFTPWVHLCTATPWRISCLHPVVNADEQSTI